jgi:hypothetical protein
MIAGGVTVVEVTMTVPNAVDLIKELKKQFGDDPCSAQAPSLRPIRPRPPSTPERSSS